MFQSNRSEVELSKDIFNNVSQGTCCEPTPTMTSCLCGFMSVRAGTIVFSIIDVLSMASLSVYVFIPGGDIRFLLYPFLPYTLFAVASVLGLMGSFTRKEKITAFYAYAVVFFPITCLILAIVTGRGFSYDLIGTIINTAIGWWKYIVAINASKVFARGGSGDDVQHKLLT